MDGWGVHVREAAYAGDKAKGGQAPAVVVYKSFEEGTNKEKLTTIAIYTTEGGYTDLTTDEYFTSPAHRDNILRGCTQGMLKPGQAISLLARAHFKGDQLGAVKQATQEVVAAFTRHGVPLRPDSMPLAT